MVLLKNTPERFGLVTKCLHWVIAALIIGLIGLGYYMVGLTYFDPWYNGSLSLHRSLGMMVLPFAALYIAWKAYSPSPALPERIGEIQRRTATLVHYFFIAMMVVIPVSGYIVSTSAGKPVPVFDWLDVPPLLDSNTTLRDWAIKIHFYLAYTVAALVCVHVLAAFKHQWIDRVGTLARMTWR